MKFNLKNRPRPGCYKDDPEEHVIKAYAEWFEGFEKELREHLAKQERILEQTKDNESKHALETRQISLTFKYLLEEILGE